MNVAVTTAAEGFPRRAFTVDDIARMIEAGIKGLKARLCARHRVKEFWVIDANEGITYVHTDPDGDGWSSIVKRGPQDASTTPTLAGLSVRLDEID